MVHTNGVMQRGRKYGKIFWVPQEARWSHLVANARQPAIGKLVDEAMLAIERDNPSLKGVLPKDYAHPRLDRQRLGQLIDLIGNIGLGGETLFIDARKMGTMVDRVHRELTEEDIAHIADTYHAWRGDGEINAKTQSRQDAKDMEKGHGDSASLRPGVKWSYADVPGFCRAATLDDIRRHNHILTPGRYVGAAEVEEDDEPFEEKMERLTAQLEEQFAESARLDRSIVYNLAHLGFWQETS